VRGLPTPRAAAEQLTSLVRAEMRYQPGSTSVHSRGEDAWGERTGVCQDFAHVTVGALRSLGVPARYISGYLVPVRDTEVGETSKGESHAWVEYWDGGWTPVDPTNGTEVGVDHVVVARGRDYEDVSPFKGIYSGRATASLGVVVAITRLA
jgi:transglutaminase-like putative cysteine protease